MNLEISEEQQSEMRHAYYEGAPGILVSGLVWIAAALVGYQFGAHKAVWTLLIGGAVIYPISAIVAKAMGRPAKTSKANALNQLAMASTIWLILGCAMSYGLYLLMPALFFPAMMATIGCRYFIFATVYGKSIFWTMGVSLIVAGNLAYFAAVAPAAAAAVGGLIEIAFAFYVYLTAPKPVSLAAPRRGPGRP